MYMDCGLMPSSVVRPYMNIGSDPMAGLLVGCGESRFSGNQLFANILPCLVNLVAERIHHRLTPPRTVSSPKRFTVAADFHRLSVPPSPSWPVSY